MQRRTFLMGALAAGARAQNLVTTPGELQAAIAAARAGDTVTMANGVWRNIDIAFGGAGTAEQPITLRAETPGGVTLAGTSRLRMGGRWLVAEGLKFSEGAPASQAVEFRLDSRRLAEDCRLTQCAIVDYNTADAKTDTKWVGLYGVRNRVDHCYFAGKKNLGTTLVVWLPAEQGEPNGHRIDRNWFGPRPPFPENGAETIRVGTSTTSMQVSATIVEENLFEECDGEIECISNKSCENVYRWNTFRRVQGSLTLRHGNRCRVEGNFFFGEERARTAGIRIIGEDHAVFNNYLEGITGTEARAALAMQNGIVDSPLEGYFQVQRALVVHNTVFRCQQSMAFGTGGDPLRPRDCTMANNVLQGFGPERLEWSDPWLGGNLITRDDQELRFLRGGDGVWRPSGMDSPVKGQAVEGFAWVFEDIEGRPRVTPSDLGCFSLYGERTRAPLARGDVGPEWMARP